MRMIGWSVVLGALLLALGACREDGGSPEVASLDPPSSVPAETMPAELGHDDALLGFARCMRDEGVSMPDPEPGSDRPDMPLGETFGATRDAFLAATETCSTFLTPSEPLPEDHREELEANLLRFAKCMREQGIEMPDPKLTEHGMALIAAPEGIDPQDPRLLRAGEACQSIIDGGR